MTSRRWPSPTYFKRLLLAYGAAAMIAGMLTLIILVLIYAPVGGFSFLAGLIVGAIGGAVAKYANHHGWWTRISEVLQYPRAVST